LKLLGRDICPEKFFIDEALKRHFLVASRVVRVSSIEIDWRVPEESRDKNSRKTWQTQNLRLHHIGQTNPLERVL
jgi:hypothetical protein